MKIQQILLAAATVMLLTTSSAWAHNEGKWRPHQGWHRHGHGYGLVKAPEIDAASGTSAIALLTGVLLLTGERYRSRRS
jgi:hypothetical protein